jgi:hypothetical protein
MKRIFKESGQAIVLVLLSLAVVLTIVLFVLARSVTDIAVSSRSEEAVRAFSAAEAGIENALVIGVGSNGLVDIGNAQYVSSVTGFAFGSSDFIYPVPMLSGDSMTTWFVSHLEDGTLGCNPPDYPCYSGSSMSVCWGEAGTSQSSSTTPAIEVSVFYETSPGVTSSVNIKRVTADPYGGRPTPNGFGGITGVNCPIAGSSYAFNKTVNFGVTGLNIPAGSRLLFARVRMFYNNTTTQPVGISVSGGLLPSQGQEITSTGTAGDANRKVAVFQGWPEPPAVFDFAIYSGTGLTK